MSSHSVIFVDVETNRLLEREWPRADPLSLQSFWPDLVSVTWTFEGAPTTTMLVRPDGWTIEPVMEELCGVTTEDAMRDGHTLQHVMDSFAKALQGASLVVAHNMDFVRSVIFNAIKWRLQRDPRVLWPSNELCTSTVYQRDTGRPYMTLRSLYRHVLGKALAPGSVEVEALVAITQRQWSQPLQQASKRLELRPTS